MRSKFYTFVDKTLFDLGRQFKWSYLPPLMIYVAAGISGLTGIVGTFFVKDYLNLSAAFLAGLGFWAGIPWALKMPLGHLVDLIWNKKNYMVFVGASLISLSLLIMYGLIIHTEWMATILTVETWVVISVLLSPIGYVVQDVVADAMTVEAVPIVDDNGINFSRDEIKLMHTTMQTLGRFAIIGGTVLVALANVILFKGVDDLEQTEKISLYGSIYIYALIIPNKVRTDAISDKTEKNCSLNLSTSISNHDNPGPGLGIARKINIIIAVPTTVNLKSFESSFINLFIKNKIIIMEPRKTIS